LSSFFSFYFIERNNTFVTYNSLIFFFFVKIYIKSQNRCIECKSVWTFQKKEDNVVLKQTAAKHLGMVYEIWVFDGKNKLVEKHV
jgi:hypothetical protein